MTDGTYKEIGLYLPQANKYSYDWIYISIDYISRLIENIREKQKQITRTNTDIRTWRSVFFIIRKSSIFAQESTTLEPKQRFYIVVSQS